MLNSDDSKLLPQTPLSRATKRESKLHTNDALFPKLSPPPLSPRAPFDPSVPRGFLDLAGGSLQHHRRLLRLAAREFVTVQIETDNHRGQRDAFVAIRKGMAALQSPTIRRSQAGNRHVPPVGSKMLRLRHGRFQHAWLALSGNASVAGDKVLMNRAQRFGSQPAQAPG